MNEQVLSTKHIFPRNSRGKITDVSVHHLIVHRPATELVAAADQSTVLVEEDGTASTDPGASIDRGDGTDLWAILPYLMIYLAWGIKTPGGVGNSRHDYSHSPFLDYDEMIVIVAPHTRPSSHLQQQPLHRLRSIRSKRRNKRRNERKRSEYGREIKDQLWPYGKNTLS